MSLEKTKQWFEQAVPSPSQDHAIIQLGCHIEEVAEMFESMGAIHIADGLHSSANQFKRKHKDARVVTRSVNKNSLLDALVDQIVTAVGVGHMMGMDVLGALEEVNRSNFSKFEDGKPVFDANGKIAKGKDYVKPNLEKFV
ncbi:NTP pyrophosphohydrolase-like domain [Vibrio phage 1.177.O._10N.286.45.E10]|nr:NTP pyrophosphohydrolase-like domain [Vibrio phage 1.177.O._10N.286.45.E10]